MPCLITDSGPLIALAKLGLLDLPARLFGRAAMPETVFTECPAQSWLTDARAIQTVVDAGHLGLSVVGVCGLLLRANHLGWLGSLALPLSKLRQAGYFISPALVAAVLARAGGR